MEAPWDKYTGIAKMGAFVAVLDEVRIESRQPRKIGFGLSQPWSDRLGKHTVIEIREGEKVIGKITGSSGVGIPVMQYTVECEGLRAFTAYSLKDAKAFVVSNLSR